MDESILEPVELYNSQLKESLKKNAADYFDDLVKKSGISINDNIETIKKLSTAKLKLEKVNKKVGKYHTYKTLLIILIIVISLIGVILLYSSIQNNLSLLIGIISFVVAIIIDILSIVCIIKKLNPAIKDESVKQKKLNEQIKSLEAEAWRQMLPLNQLYDWNMTADIIKKTTPLIQLDPFFDTKKCQYLIEKYGISENNDQNVSTINVLSGSILGNPFLIYRNYSQTWFNKTYMGSIVIHWQERYRDSDGHYRTVTRSQTLTASITRRAPSYQHNTYLIYGNDAAPTLTFSRSPSNIEGMDEKDIEKKVKSEVKKLDDKAKDAIKNNQNFVRLGNDEFEVLLVEKIEIMK